MAKPTEESLDWQIALRDATLDLITQQRFIGSMPMSEVHAVVACMGAASVFAALLPKEAREKLSDHISLAFPDHVEKRAAEIASGEFDDHMSRRRN